MKLDYVKFTGEIEIYPSMKTDSKNKVPTKVKGNVHFVSNDTNKDVVSTGGKKRIKKSPRKSQRKSPRRSKKY